MEQVRDRQIAAKWAHDLLKNNNFCVLDTETTGLDSAAEICQLAVLRADGVTLFDTLIRPSKPIPVQATKIHGITDEMVQAAPFFHESLISLLRAVGSQDLVIYNAEFDLKLLRQSARACGFHLAFPNSDWRPNRIFLNGGSIHCAMQYYSQWFGEWNEYHGNYKWQKLHGGDHSALGDCRATLALVRQMAASYSFTPVEQLGEMPNV